jgi:hypothetical protein
VYGLKQSGFAYYQRIKTDMEANGYSPLKADCCVFLRIVKAPPGAHLSDFARTHGGYEIVIIALWVDDNKIAYSAPHMLDRFRDYGEWKYSLGLDISYSRSEGSRLLLSSKSYLSAFFNTLPFKCTPPHLTPAPTGVGLKCEDCVEGSLSENKFWWSGHFRRCLGAMSHIQNWTFPELAVYISMISQYLTCLGQPHWDFLFRVLCYVHANMDASRIFSHQEPGTGRVYFGYADADYAGCVDSRRSRTGYCFFLFGNLVGHCSKLQRCVSLSTCEAEYLALAAACQFVMWSVQLLRELGVVLPKCFELFCDSKSAADIAQSPVGSKYTKHIDVRLLFLKEFCCDHKLFDIVFTRSPSNVANAPTKTTPSGEFLHTRDVLRGVSKDHPALHEQVLARFSTPQAVQERHPDNTDGLGMVLYTHTLSKI